MSTTLFFSGLLLWCVVVILDTSNGEAASFRFGNTQGSNMVLQQAPQRAQIWGFAELGDEITVKLMQGTTVVQTVVVSPFLAPIQNASLFHAQLAPIRASFTQYSVTATSKMASATITMSNLLFGDVYLCGGQSNMQFTVDQLFNASQQTADANKYPHIRTIAVAQTQSNVPLNEVLSLQLPWSVANNVSIGGGNWSYTSAVCWLFGRNLFDALQYPIGLIGSNFGGTPVRAWSSATALAQCPMPMPVPNKVNPLIFHGQALASLSTVNKAPLNYEPVSVAALLGDKADENTMTDEEKKAIDAELQFLQRVSVGGPGGNSVLWNAMIVPFLRTSIKGAIWYQGEADGGSEPYASMYNCTFPAMIADWRLNFNQFSDTNADFPFGYVHLSVWGDGSNNTCGDNADCTMVAQVRFGQSANFGYVPNPHQPNVFMATAIDLGDPSSPFGDIHPRYKVEVGQRLSAAALNVVYGHSNVYWQGPIADGAMLSADKSAVVINFRNVDEQGLEIRNGVGFEMLSGANNWTAVADGNTNMVANSMYNIQVTVPNGVSSVTQIRYNWYTAPCLPKMGIHNCGIYDKQNQLPATPFKMNVM